MPPAEADAVTLSRVALCRSSGRVGEWSTGMMEEWNVGTGMEDVSDFRFWVSGYNPLLLGALAMLEERNGGMMECWDSGWLLFFGWRW